MKLIGKAIAIAMLALVAAAAAARQITPQTPPAPWIAVHPIEPPAAPLPSEAASAQVTRFAVIAYGDTRSSGVADVPGDGQILHPEHSRLVDRMIARINEARATPFLIRFVLQSGDAVLRGMSAPMWNVSFSPIIERLTRGANIPYFFSVGNPDVTTMPPGDPGRALALHNTLTAMSSSFHQKGRRGV